MEDQEQFGMDANGGRGNPARKIRFERKASQIMFDPASSCFVVTWSRCVKDERVRLEKAKDPMSYLPSIGAVATLYDRGCIPPAQNVYAARAIGRAWAAGDREGLDTESAKRAAELVVDLSSMCVDETSPSVARDIGQAMRHLLDEMAAVRFSGTKPGLFSEEAVMPALLKSAGECLSAEWFLGWPRHSMRRRFIFCLNRRERTPVAYTIVSLLFDCGSCPLLSLSDRRALRMVCARESRLDAGFTEASVGAFCKAALKEMRVARSEGRTRVTRPSTPQDLVDMISESSPTNAGE